MAISAFYVHKRSVDQVLDRLIEISCKLPQRDRSRLSSDDEETELGELENADGCGDEGEFGSDGEVFGGRNMRGRSVSGSFQERMEVFRSFPVSSSVPNVALGNQWLEEDAKFDETVRARLQSFSAASVDRLNFIPSGLPSLQTARRGDGELILLSGYQICCCCCCC